MRPGAMGHRWKRHRRLSRDAARTAAEREIKRLAKESAKSLVESVPRIGLAAVRPGMAEEELPEAGGPLMLDDEDEDDGPGPECEYEREVELA